MDCQLFITGLSQGAEMIQSMVRHVSKDQALWRPAPKKWSILEVIHHLLDEEQEDFRQRLDITLNRPEESWPGIDPEAWAVDRAYNQKELNDVLGKFLRERQRSIAWLRGLEKPDWDKTYTHPKIGPISAGELLCAWGAHDFLHLRQLAGLHLDYVAQAADPYSIRYASP